MSCVSHVFPSVNCCLVVTCWERADLLALVGGVYLFLLLSHVGQVGYLIVSFPDLCRLFTFILTLDQNKSEQMPDE